MFQELVCVLEIQQLAKRIRSILALMELAFLMEKVDNKKNTKLICGVN